MYNRYDSQMKIILTKTTYYEGEVIPHLLPWLLRQVEVILSEYTAWKFLN